MLKLRQWIDNLEKQTQQTSEFNKETLAGKNHGKKWNPLYWKKEYNGGKRTCGAYKIKSHYDS